MKTGIELIAIERLEQMQKHGRNVEDDLDNNPHFQLSYAARILSTVDIFKTFSKPEDVVPNGWDLEIWSKMFHKPIEDRLIIAGALIAAEIDRLTVKRAKFDKHYENWEENEYGKIVPPDHQVGRNELRNLANSLASYSLNKKG